MCLIGVHYRHYNIHVHVYTSPCLAVICIAVIITYCILINLLNVLLICLLHQENYPGEYLDFTAYHSRQPAEYSAPAAPQGPLKDAPPASPPADVPDTPQERFLDVEVDFALRNITVEFPTV